MQSARDSKAWLSGGGRWRERGAGGWNSRRACIWRRMVLLLLRVVGCRLRGTRHSGGAFEGFNLSRARKQHDAL